VQGFVAELGLSWPVLMGHSQAGPVGVVLAAHHRDAVGHLVLIDAMGTGPHSAVRVFTAGLVDLVREFGIVPGRWHHVVGNLLSRPRNFVRQVRDALAADTRAEAGRLAVPTLVAWGGRSVAFPPRPAGEYARCRPDARLYLSPRGCHDWLIARPDEFAAAVEAFVRPSAAAG
jgi:pimeloyl-ACP methyl ester carboxylesterase